MDPITTAGAALAAIKGAIKLAKDVKESVIIEKMNDAYEKVLTVVEEKAELQQKVRDLQQKVSDLEKQTTTADDLDFKDEMYFKKSDKLGPYCTVCFDTKKLLVRLHLWSPREHCFECPSCKKIVPRQSAQVIYPRQDSY